MYQQTRKLADRQAIVAAFKKEQYKVFNHLVRYAKKQKEREKTIGQVRGH